MTNAGIENIGIFSKNKSRSLMDHLSNGRPWDFIEKEMVLGYLILENEDPVYDDVHTFAHNMEFLKYSKQEYVVLSSSYMIM